jgi:cell division protein FtsB
MEEYMKRETKIFSKLIITATFVGIFLFLMNGCGKEEMQKLRSENEAIKNEEQMTKKENEALKVKIVSLEQEIAKLKETADYHYQQGVDLLKDNKFQEAKAEFDTVIEKYPESPFVSSAKQHLEKISLEIKRVETDGYKEKDGVASGLSNPKVGVFGFKWGAPPTGLTKNEKGAYIKDGITYMFSGPNDRFFSGIFKPLTREETTSLIKQFTNRYGKPEVKEQGQKWGKSYDWTISNVPFDFNGEIHPTDVTITVTTGGSEHGPKLMIMNSEIFQWGVFLKTKGYQ